MPTTLLRATPDFQTLRRPCKVMFDFQIITSFTINSAQYIHIWVVIFSEGALLFLFHQAPAF